MTTDIETLVSEAIGLLKSLIAIPSLSREEGAGCGLSSELHRNAGNGNRTERQQYMVSQPDVRPEQTYACC